MNKKSFSYIIITILCLNLLPQPNNAFQLDETKTDVIYINEDEKDNWETRYMPYARHLKLINKTMTIVDVAKEAEQNPYLIPDIMKRTLYERGKAIVKWERDNGYIATEAEENFQITPQIRRKMLAEIEEEEEREWGKAYAFSFKVIKAIVCTTSAISAFSVAKYKKLDMTEAVRLTATVFAFVTASVSGLEVIGEVTWNKIKQWRKGDDEIKLPPLRNMPVIPKGHRRVDVYSL
jgi:hypothetical protein